MGLTVLNEITLRLQETTLVLDETTHHVMGLHTTEETPDSGPEIFASENETRDRLDQGH